MFCVRSAKGLKGWSTRFVGDLKVALGQVYIYPLSTLVVHYQYHSTIAPYSFIHLPPTLYNFFSQYFSFPCQYHSTVASYSASSKYYFLSEGHAGEARKPFEKQCFFANRRALGSWCPTCRVALHACLVALTVATAEINRSAVLHDHKIPVLSLLLSNASFPFGSP